MVDSSYPEGAFAFFSNSQAQVNFGDFTLASLDDLAADAGEDQTVTAGTVELSGSDVLGVPPIQCEWFDATQTSISQDCVTNVAVSATSTFTLTVTDDFDRTSSDTVTGDCSVAATKVGSTIPVIGCNDASGVGSRP